MSVVWNKLGSTMEVSGEGLVVTKESGGDFFRQVAAGEELSSGVHTWEVEITSGAKTNGNRDMQIGVAKKSCDIEKGDHHTKGDAWYLRTHDCKVYGVDANGDDISDDEMVVEEEKRADGSGGGGRIQGHKYGKFFVKGDRIGLRLNCDDGSLKFYKNGEALGKEFPAGTIKVPVVRALELKMKGQSATLMPDTELA